MKFLTAIVYCFYGFIASTFADETGMRAAFEQERFLTGFEQPIKSSGYFYLYANGDIVWETLVPFASKMVITKTDVVQFVGDKQTFRLPVQKFAAMERVQEMFEASLRGNVEDLLSSMGNTDFKKLDVGWEIKLSSPEGQENFPYC